jgi:hypothetical protein
MPSNALETMKEVREMDEVKFGEVFFPYPELLLFFDHATRSLNIFQTIIPTW